jgi:hypothetical protein
MTVRSTDPLWDNTVLAMIMDGPDGSTAFRDIKAGKGVTARGNVHIETDQYKYGSASAAFDGSGDSLGFGDHADFAFPGDFTIEMWIYPVTWTGTSCIFSTGVITNGLFIGRYDPNGGGLGVIAFNGGWILTSTVIPATGTWSHVELTRVGTNLRLFLNGALVGTLASDSRSYTQTDVRFGEHNGASYFTGYIDDVQVIKGAGRHTSAFTVGPSIYSRLDLRSWGLGNLPFLYTNDRRDYTDLAYLAVPTLKGLADLPYASRLLPRAQVDLAYRHRPESGCVFDLPYGSLTVARAETDCPYLMSAGIVVNQQDLAYRITDQVVVGTQTDLPYWGEASPALVTVVSACTVAGVTVDPLAMDLTWSRDQYALSASLTLTTGSDYALAQVGAAVVLTLQGTDYHLQVESRQRQRSHGEWSYTVGCLSPAAWLDAPYAQTINGGQTGLASVVAANLAGSVSLSWQTVDWTLAPGDLFATDQTPLALIRQLAAAPGGILVSLPDGSLVVEPAYPVAVNRWSQSTPAAVLRESMDVISASESDDYRPGYNVYLITDQVATADTLRIETEAESDLVSLLRVYQTPWADDFDFRHTGGNWVQLSDIGIEQRQVSEVVEFVAGEGRTQYPIYSLDSVSWQQVNLGAVSFIEAGTLTAAIEGESLLSLTYTTRCRRYRARDSRAEQVQFVAEVIA